MKSNIEKMLKIWYPFHRNKRRGVIMIAVKTNETLTIYDISFDEFRDIVYENESGGLNSERIQRTQLGFTISNNDAMDFLSDRVVKSIERCVVIDAGKIISGRRPNSIEDLKFYVSEDGKQYASEEVYKASSSLGKNSPTPEKQSEVLRPAVEGPKPKPASVVASPKPKPAAVVEGPKPKPASVVASPKPKPAARVSRGKSKPRPAVVIPDEQLQFARLIDGQIKNYYEQLPSFSAPIMAAIQKNVRDNIEKFRDRAKAVIGFKKGTEPLLKNCELGFEMESQIGSTNNMLDSLLVFEVKAKIFLKSKPFALFGGIRSKLVGSTFSSVCPLFTSEDGKQKGYQFEKTITDYDLDGAEAWLSTHKGLSSKDLKKMDEDEAYSLYLQALESVYRRRNNGLFHTRDGVSDLTDYQKQLREQYGKEADFRKWDNALNNLTFDVRPVSLTEQLGRIAKGEQPLVMASPKPVMSSVVPPKPAARVDAPKPASVIPDPSHDKSHDGKIQIDLKGASKVVQQAAAQLYGEPIDENGELWVPEFKYIAVCKNYIQPDAAALGANYKGSNFEEIPHFLEGELPEVIDFVVKSYGGRINNGVVFLPVDVVEVLKKSGSEIGNKLKQLEGQRQSEVQKPPLVQKVSRMSGQSQSDADALQSIFLQQFARIHGEEDVSHKHL